jgi:hypothetical protein
MVWQKRIRNLKKQRYNSCRFLVKSKAPDEVFRSGAFFYFTNLPAVLHSSKLYMTIVKKFALIPALVSLLLLAGTSYAQKGTLQDISFLEGHWLGTYNGGPIEAGWTAPAAENIVGYIRMMKDNKPALYEMFVFEQTAQGPVAMVKHFRPGMVGVEEKDKHDHYVFLSAKKNEALFEKEDASVRIIYERRKDNQLVIRRGSKKDGEWTFVDLFIFDKIP